MPRDLVPIALLDPKNRNPRERLFLRRRFASPANDPERIALKLEVAHSHVRATDLRNLLRQELRQSEIAFPRHAAIPSGTCVVYFAIGSESAPPAEGRTFRCAAVGVLCLALGISQKGSARPLKDIPAMVALPASRIIVRVLLTHYRRPGPLLHGEFEFGHEFPKVDHIQFAHLTLPVEGLASR